ncbi:L,D-transpeptidase [Priestia endophytica]|uniref:L,D-transpeptidase n=1 Tax=Priestia endophytica TaxID=135735 RepID=UPI000DCA880F|nr:L,D-transpeptidase [Priestia endophytica]RAS72824.1 L,D-transpeptidase [Priestia endophytica]
MKKILIKIMTVLALIVVLFGEMATGKTEVASNTANQDLIVINKHYNKLAYYHNGYLEMVAPVATGKTWDKTPVGFFKVVNKIKNRPYYTEKIPGGDLRNPLGKRWLGLNANGTYGDTYGIHGNSNESSIGKYVSQGCIRMHNADVEKFYDKVQVGTPVIITYFYRSFEELAKVYRYDFKGYNTKN